MKKEYIKLGILIAFVIGLTFLVIGNYNEIALCVDGDGDINLEGLMCDKKIDTIFGFDVTSSIGSLLIISYLFGMIWLVFIVTSKIILEDEK